MACEQSACKIQLGHRWTLARLPGAVDAMILPRWGGSTELCGLAGQTPVANGWNARFAKDLTGSASAVGRSPAAHLRHAPGNSGSPVIDVGLQKVVGLHHAGSRRDSVNFAIPMGLILERSNLLVAALEASVATVTAANPVETANNGNRAICDALFAEARSSADYVVYEIYAEACTDHPLVAIAAKFRQANCTAATTTGAVQPKTEILPAPAPVRAYQISAATHSGRRHRCELGNRCDRHSDATERARDVAR